jgi:hypothetical protein
MEWFWYFEHARQSRPLTDMRGINGWVDSRPLTDMRGINGWVDAQVLRREARGFSAVRGISSEKNRRLCHKGSVFY